MLVLGLLPPCSTAAPARRLVFHPPMIVSGPPTDVSAASFNGGGPFWANVRGLSSTHALGNQGGIITTADGGVTWTRQNASWCNASIGCTAKTSEGVDAAEVCAGRPPRSPSNRARLHRAAVCMHRAASTTWAIST